MKTFQRLHHRGKTLHNVNSFQKDKTNILSFWVGKYILNNNLNLVTLIKKKKKEEETFIPIQNAEKICHYFSF